METMREKILKRVEELKPGTAFMAKDFLDIASRGSIDVMLSSLLRQRTIRRVRRGLYDKPKVNSSLGGELSPDLDEAVRAIARSLSLKIIPSGAMAANSLVLSTQVPAKIIYLTDGPSKKIQIGRRTVYFKHVRPKTLAGASDSSALVIQALRYLGKDRVTDENILKLRNILSKSDCLQLVEETRFAANWIHDLAKKIAEDKA